MPAWVTLAKSPLSRFTVLLFALGLLRLVLLSLWEMRAALHRAHRRDIPYARLLRESLAWLFPITRLHRVRAGYSLASFIFHLGILIVTPFLGNHVDLFRDHFGLAWPALLKPVLDILTLLTLFAGAYLLFSRIYNRASRKLSNAPDYLLLALILCIFCSGFLSGQSWNPIPYDGLMLLHIISGMLLLAIIPFTKIAHCVLYPLVRLGTFVAWQFPPQAGKAVVQRLHGPEGRRI